MVRKVDNQSRLRSVLASAINRYIKNAMPVSSEEMAKEFGLSSATIRNIFAELEEAGYLTHPYTSAGRVPTDKGYRYYVDFLLAEMELLDEEKSRVTSEYKRQLNRIEDVLEATSEMVSALTGCAGIVSFLDWQDKIFYKGISSVLDQPEFQDLGQMRFLIRMIEDKRDLLSIVNRDFEDKVKVYIGKEIGCSQISNCALAVSRYKVKKKPAGRLAVLGPTRMEYEHIIPTLEYVSDVLTEVLDDF